MRLVQADCVFPPEDEPAAADDEEPMVPVRGAREDEGPRGSSKSLRSALGWGEWVLAFAYLRLSCFGREVCI